GAGGAYLPVLCDKILMTEGSGLYLAGPSLVKAAIGQIVDQEELGGAKMHSEISGTVDFYEKDDEACLEKLRSLVAMLPEANEKCDMPVGKEPGQSGETIYDLIGLDGHKNYDARDLLATIIDAESLYEYKADYGKTLVTTYARIGGRPVGIVASQRLQVRTKTEGIQMGGVIYSDSADKAARFVMDCNQVGLPIIFFQDVTGFMVGKTAEQSGIIRSGAKLVNAVSNSIVPKITIVVGGSFGAGNYALCGKAYDPRFILAWPNARYAVMGAAQASDTIFSVLARAAERGDKKASPEDLEKLRATVKANYEEQTDIRNDAAMFQRAQHFLRRNVADEIVLRERTSAETAERRIEPATASVERRHDFCRGFSACPVKMHTDLHFARDRGDYARNQIRRRRS